MKRILAILWMGILPISLAACGSAQDDVSEEAAAEAAEEPAAATEDNSGDTGYYQLENDAEDHENTKEGRADGVKISPFRAGDDLVHVARIM